MKLRDIVGILFLLLTSVSGLRADSWQMTTLSVVAGQSQALALRSDGSVWAWGVNQSGEIGISNLASSSFPVRVAGVSNVINIAAGWQHSLAVETNGTVWAWGNNIVGQLGNGSYNTSSVPVQVLGITNAISVAGGGFHSLALLANGQVLGWGANGNGQLGTVTNIYTTNQPILIAGLSNVVKVVAGAYHSLALDKSGMVWAWGYDHYGQLGDGHSNDVSITPTVVLSNVTDIAAGIYHTIALKSDHTVWTWGLNNDGQLGVGNQTTINIPTQVTALSGVQVIGAGQYSSAATLTNGQNFIWGYQYGNVLLPTLLAPAQPFLSYALGLNNNTYNFSLGLTTNGAVWAWGANLYGQFGNGNIMSPFSGNLYFIPTESFAATPIARWGEFLRGNTFDFNNVTNHDLDFCSIVVPIDMEQGVALNATGSDSYCYSNPPPWFLSVSNQLLFVANSLASGTNLNLIPIKNPVVAFGSQGGGSPLYPNQPYRFGVYAGGFDESTSTATNVIRISVYSATNFIAGASNVVPVNVFNIPLPRRTVSADSNLWTTFMSNGAAITLTTNGLTTTVQFLDTGDPYNLPFSLSWLNGSIITNFILTGYQLTHVAANTNYCYRVEVLGKVQVGTNLLAPMATNSAGVWTALPLYTLDFTQPASTHSVYLDRLFFQGTPTPPTYTETYVVGPAGINVAVTNQYSLTNSQYSTLDGSPEIRRHPLLDQFVLDMNKDPLALASYVINEIELVDPYAVGNGSTQVQPQVTCGGIDRSALGTFLEGRGSPVEQCALLVYLLRQAGYSAAYVFPTNNNLFMSASHISQLWEVQVNGILYANGIPYIANSLLSANYPWVVANIGTNTVHIFPWLKDHEIVEGVNLYDYMPTNYNTALAWVEQYCRANTNILNLDSNNVVSKLFPAFVQQYLNPLGPSFSLDNLGVRSLNRRHQFPGWSYLPQPDAVSNLNSVAVVDYLNDSANFKFLTNIFNTAEIQVCDTNGGIPFLDSGIWNACDLNDRKFLFFTDNGRLSLWLASYRPGITAVQTFAGPSSTALQSNSVPYGVLDTNSGAVLTNGLTLTINIIHNRQRNTLLNNTPYADLPLREAPSTINVTHCQIGDVVAMALDFGHVTPLMLQQHEETYWNIQRQIATNSTYAPSIWDFSGTAAYLLGMGYFEKFDTFDTFNQQWHKLHSIVKFSSGLGVIGATGSTNKMQAKVDMLESFDLFVGNGSIHPDSGYSLTFTSPAWLNYINLFISNVSSQEHDVIQSMFPDLDAVSTVRLLQLAQQRATNGNSPILELYYNNYLAAGNKTNSGYGTNLLKNVDPQTWSSVTNIFNQAGGNYARVLITPGNVTNNTKSYIGMGALVFGETKWQALISGNTAALNGGWGSILNNFNTISSSLDGNYGLSYVLNDSGSGYISFSINAANTPGIGDTIAYMLSMQDFANLSSGNATYNYTPQQNNQALQTSVGLGQTGASTSMGIRGNADSGFWSIGKFFSSAGTTVYDPVNVYSGEFYIDTVDLTLPGPLPLDLRRNYTSQSLTANQLGYGWKISFNPYLCLASNLIYAAEPDGTTLAYRPTNGVWKVFPQDNPTLNNNSTHGIGSTANLFNSLLTTNNGTNYVINVPDGSVRTYQIMSFPIVSSTNVMYRTRPYLTQWQDDAGNYASFFYGTNSSADDWGQLNRVNLSNGNSLVFKYDFYGRIIQAIAGDGRLVNYQYDTYGDLTTVTLPDLSQCQYQYQHYTFTSTNGTNHADSLHLISQEIKPSGRILANYYDSMRRVVNQASTVGTNLVLVTNAYFYYTNNLNTNNYVTNQFVSGITRVDDVFHNPTYYYYTNNLITNTVDPLGGTNLAVWFPDSPTNLTGYYPRSLAYSVDKRGLTNQFFYDSFGNVTQSVFVGNLTGEGLLNQTATNTASYTTNNLPYLTQDPAGNGMQFVYDGSDPFRPIQTIRLAGATPIVTNFFYYTNVAQVSTLGTTNLAFGRLARLVNAGATNDFSYSGSGFLTQTIRYPATTDNPSDTDPAIVHYLSYNQRGQLIQDQTAGGGLNQFDYDPMGRMISRQSFDQFGNTLSQEFFYYNRNGQLEWYDGPHSNPSDYTYFIYDGAGRVIQQIKTRSQAKSDGSGVEAPAGNNQYAATFQSFDSFGNLTSITDPRGAMTTNAFDALGRMTTQKSLDLNGSVLQSSQFAYEKGGLVTLATNGLGGVTRVLYTTTGKPYYIATPDGATNAVTYYLDGRVKQQTQRNGAYWLTTYDDVNLITTRVFYTASGVPLATNAVQTDKRGNVVQNSDVAGNIFTTSFDGLDRVKKVAGPAIVAVTVTISGGLNPGGTNIYTTNILQHCVTNYFDAAGLSLTNVNAMGETTISQFDTIGRLTSGWIYSSSGSLVRERYYGYSGDHNAVMVTDGSGAGAISTTSWTDNDGHTVLVSANPSAGINEFTLNQFDLSGNLVSSRHNSSANGSITIWTTMALTYDGLNRPTQKVDRDGATSTYAYDALNDLTNRTMPGNLQWQATYNNAGNILSEKIVGGGSGTRTNTYSYFSGGNSFAGLLQTKTDGRGVSCAFSYDDWLRPTNLTYSGSLPEQNVTTVWQYEPRGYVTSITEQFASTNTGPATSVQRTFDAYGQLTAESVNGGAFSYGASQSWDVVGRRSQLGIGGNSYAFGWQADGPLSFATSPTGNGTYVYTTAGVLTNRTVGSRITSIQSFDGEGRPLSINTSVNGTQQLNEILTWSPDGLLATHTLTRDFTDSRAYTYANLSRRLTQEQLNLNSSTAWTNTFVYDNGVAAKPGVLTQMGQSSALWAGVADSFSRVATETNNTFLYPATGHVNGQSTLTATVDNQPVSVTAVGTNSMQWRAMMELTSGTHQLTVAAAHPSGFYTAWATNFFTNNIAYQTTGDTFDNAGNITQRVWRNASGTTNRTQTLSWDARGRLHSVTERDATNSGFNWTAVYDGLNRRLSTTSILVTNSVAFTNLPTTVNSYFDPLVEFLELGVTYGTKTEWKLYGPDLNGVYGGMNGTGGFEAVSPYLNLFNPVISDFRGNILGVVTNGTVAWNSARPTGYGAVPGYRPLALGNSANISLSSAWRGRWVDITGYNQIGLRPYDPISGRWLTYDSVWNERDPNAYTFCGGDPVNGFDPDGRLGKAAANFTYNGGVAGYGLRALGGYLDNYNNISVGGGYLSGAAGALINELAGISAPSTYVKGLANYGDNVNAIYQDSGIIPATSYAISGWNIGAVYSGVANLDLVTGGEVGDWYQRGAEISGGVANTAGLAFGGTRALTLSGITAPAENFAARTYFKIIDPDKSVGLYNSFVPGTARLNIELGGRTLYRAADSLNDAQYGRFASTEISSSPSQAMQRNALAPQFGNSASDLYQVTTRPGLSVEGVSASQGANYPGGAIQVFQNRPSANIPTWSTTTRIGYPLSTP